MGRLLTLFFAIATSFAYADITGIYEGFMHLTDGAERVVSLSVSLSETGEIDSLTTAEGTVLEVPVVDGGVLVDGEGGPYLMSRVAYRPDKFTIDMRYSRGEKTAASFRLSGFIDQDGVYFGKVSSGGRGNIGTFRVTLTDKTGLVATTKYVGTYRGTISFDDGRVLSTNLVIKAMAVSKQDNPSDYEFDFTPGKFASITVGASYPPSIFSRVSFDYLRRRINFYTEYAGEPLFGIDGVISSDGKTITGDYFGRGNGTGTITVRR